MSRCFNYEIMFSRLRGGQHSSLFYSWRSGYDGFSMKYWGSGVPIKWWFLLRCFITATKLNCGSRWSRYFDRGWFADHRYKLALDRWLGSSKFCQLLKIGVGSNFRLCFWHRITHSSKRSWGDDDYSICFRAFRPFLPNKLGASALEGSPGMGIER